jgi:hypothetical protein
MPDIGDTIEANWYKGGRDLKGEIVGYILKPDRETKTYITHEPGNKVDVNFMLILADEKQKQSLKREPPHELVYGYVKSSHGGARRRATRRKTRKH